MWKIKLEMLLIRQDYFQVVDGTSLDPGPTNPVLQAEWKTKDAKARSCVLDPPLRQ